MTPAIDALRAEIETLDRELVRVLVARHSAVQKIAAQKAALGVPMHDATQEERVVARATALAHEGMHGMITAVFRALFEQARGGG
jgi:chorismate mutase